MHAYMYVHIIIIIHAWMHVYLSYFLLLGWIGRVNLDLFTKHMYFNTQMDPHKQYILVNITFDYHFHFGLQGTCL